MLSRSIILVVLAATISTSACKKNKAPQPQPDEEKQLVVLGYTQNAQSDYDNHHRWSKTGVDTYTRIGLNNSPIDFMVMDEENVIIAQNGSFWKNGVKTDLFQPGGVTTSVSYEYYNHTLGVLVRKPAQDPQGVFDYSIIESSNTIFTVPGTAQSRYEFKDFIKAGNTYYLLGYHTNITTDPIIYTRTGAETTVINLRLTAQQNFQPTLFKLYGTRFFCLGYINANGVLRPAILSLNTSGSDKEIRELNLPANTVLYDFLVDGSNLHVSGWEPKGDGSYYAFYLKNDQKFPLSNEQSRAMQLFKHNNDIYVAGLEWSPSLTYKIWKNGQDYGVIKTAANKPIVPMQLLMR